MLQDVNMCEALHGCGARVQEALTIEVHGLDSPSTCGQEEEAWQQMPLKLGLEGGTRTGRGGARL